MSTDITCNDARSQLMDLVDQFKGDFDREALNSHLEHCEDCRTTLSELWELQSMATRWQESPVPGWPRRVTFFGRRNWLPAVQIASALASVVVLVLTLGQAHLSTKGGFSVSFGGDYVRQEQLKSQLNDLRKDEQENLATSIDRLNANQKVSNQLVMHSLLTTSRDERRQDLSNLLTVLQDAQSRQARQTRSSLQYLIAGQVQDRRDINQLDRAVRLVATHGHDL